MSITLFLGLVAAHFFGSLFLHSFFLHRYSTHRQFTMSPGWEKFFFILTWLAQGPSAMSPKSYAILHLEHHAHSDTEHDPHSPLNFSNKKWGSDFLIAMPKMMMATIKAIREIKHGVHRVVVLYRERKFPEWQEFESFSQTTTGNILTSLMYIALYAAFAPVWWCWLFLPITLINGGIQGAIVNWCGHMWGYRNFNSPDNSKNTWVLSTVMLGELFQNNHHEDPDNANFARKWFEFDPAYVVIIILDTLRIIQLKR